MPHFRHEFWLFFTHTSQKQAPHDLQTYIFSGENDLLHDVHFIIITAFFLYIIYRNYTQKNAIYTLSEKAESYPQNHAPKFTRRKNGNLRNKTIKTIKNSPKSPEKQPENRSKQRFLFHVEQMWTTNCFTRNIQKQYISKQPKYPVVSRETSLP